MSDITDILWDYEEARRGLWNNFFRKRAGVRYAGEFVEDFQEIDRVLFLSLVWRSIGADPPQVFTLGVSSFASIRVVLDETTTSVSVMFNNRPGGLGGKWSNGELSRTGFPQLEFVEFFDWDQVGFHTGGFCRARISRFPGQPELIGHDVLIPTSVVQFRYEGQSPP